MNRRGFIAKALVGIAAIPFVGKLVQARPTESDATLLTPADARVGNTHIAEPRHYVGLIEHSEEGLREVNAKGYERQPFRDDSPIHFPIAAEDWGYVTHVAISESSDGPLLQWFDLHTWSRRYIKTGQATALDLDIHYI